MNIDTVATIFRRNMTALVVDAQAKRFRSRVNESVDRAARRQQAA